jgi:glycerol-3-phosphate dehydrogenase (NAD(P)+)
MRITVLGAGAWGTVLAMLAMEAGHDVNLIAHRRSSAEHMRNSRTHPHSLPGVKLPKGLHVSDTENFPSELGEVVVIAVPTQTLRASLRPLVGRTGNVSILSAVKGLEVDTLMRPSEVITQVLGGVSVAAISGPNLSSEVAAGKPATSVIAARDPGLAESLVPVFHTARFRVYTSPDITGVELGGALKNIIAIGAGMADGMHAGDNAKAAFMTRGIAEIARLGMACGADVLTFAGLSGIGDLIATCASPLSRNHRVGVGLASGKSLDEVLTSMDEVAEGVSTTRAARELGIRHGVELPIIEQMHRVLFEGVSPAEAIARLMEREPTHESPVPTD